MHETMKLGHSKVLLGDFRGAQWIARNSSEMDAETLRKRFSAIHEFFIRNVRRSRPGLFADVDPSLFVDVIRKWMVLYGEALDVLRARYPRTAQTFDLQLEGTNWSLELEISMEGLLEIGYFSRYAEVWAEKSLKGEGWYRSYPARRQFLGSAGFWHAFELAKSGTLDIVDDLGNGVTAFDLIAIARSPLFRGDLRATMLGVGWKIRTLDDDALATILWYARHGTTVRRHEPEAAPAPM